MSEIVWKKPDGVICEMVITQGNRAVYRILLTESELHLDPEPGKPSRVVFSGSGDAYYGLPDSAFGERRDIIDGEVVSNDDTAPGVRALRNLMGQMSAIEGETSPPST